VQPISWINPLDAARAMIILADTNLSFSRLQYNINGFTASCIDLLEKLDELNHSNLKLKTRILLFQKFKHWFKKVLTLVGKSNDRRYYLHLAYNTRQTFDDTHARKEWNWEPKYDLEKTLKDSLNWYLNTKF
jgi:nucleoside-diphosphate-sugar epimerase